MKTTINNQYPILTSSRKGLFLQTEYFKGTQVASKDNIGYTILPRGYFTYRPWSDDEIFYFNINTIVEKGIVNYPVFTTTKDLNPKFLEYYLNNTSDFKKFAILQKQGSTRTNLSFKKLCSFKITIPEIPEQEKIGCLFKKIDELIKLTMNEIDLLNLQKKGLLQKMFI